MGANISQDRRTIISTVTNALENNCSGSSTVDQSIENARVTLRGNAQCDTIQFTNKGTVKQQCNMDSVANAVADLAANITDEQTAKAFGLNVSMDQSTYASQAANIIKNNCSNMSNIQQEIKNIDLILEDDASCDALKFMNEADVQQVCVMKTVMDGLAKLDVEETTGQTSGIEPGASSSILLTICALSLLAGGITYAFGNVGAADSKGRANVGASDSKGHTGEISEPASNTKKIVIILVIALVIALLIGCCIGIYYFLNDKEGD
jgi:hypothetical protein